MAVQATVIIPAFNSAKTLRATIRSVTAQTFKDLEIIVIDDGSTDDTRPLLAELQKHEPRLIVLKQKRSGVAAARNNGLAAAKGRYVAFLDADDLWHPTKLQKQITALSRAADDVGMVYCWSRLIDNQDKVTASVAPIAMEGWVFNQHSYVNPLGNGSGLLVYRNVALSVGGFDNTSQTANIGAKDMLFQLQVAARWRACLVDEYLVGYRITGDNMSSDKERLFRSIAKVIDIASIGLSSFPTTAARWSRAAFLFDLISYHLSHRRPLQAFARGAEAVLSDPRMVLDRLGFALRKRTATHVDKSIGRRFDLVDPLEFGHPVSAMMRKRLAYLATLDARMDRPKPPARTQPLPSKETQNEVAMSWESAAALDKVS